MRGQQDGDSGMTLVEMLVAITLVTVGVLALLGELAADIRSQSTEKAHANAVHLASSSLESARRLPYPKLLHLLGTQTSTPPAVQGIVYTETTDVELCAVSTGASCATPGIGDASAVRASVVVSWSAGGVAHSVHMTRTLADTDPTSLGGTSAALLGSSGSGTAPAVVATLALSPSTVSVDATGRPNGSVTVTLTEVGVASASSVPLTWTDDKGAHQLTLTGSGGTYSVVVPAASITRLAGSGAVTFAATVPGSLAVPTAKLSVQAAPAFSGTCSVVAAPVVLRPLSRSTALPETLSCATTGLVRTDTVKAAYASGSGSASVALTSADGSTWTATLPAGTAVATSGLTESVVFTATRVSDSSSVSQTLLAVLA